MYLTNFQTRCDSNKSRIIFSRKRFSTTLPFPIFENKFLNGSKQSKTISQNNIFTYQLINLIIIDLFKKIENGQVIENFSPKKMIRDLL